MNISHQLTCLVLLTLLSCADITRISGTDASIDTSQDRADVTQVDTGDPDPADSSPSPVDTAVADTSTNDSVPSPDTSTPAPDTVETEEVDAGPVEPAELQGGGGVRGSRGGNAGFRE